MRPKRSPSLPQYKSQWNRRATTMGVVDSQLPDLPQIPSASKMDEQTYLAMRVLRTDRKRANNFPELKGVIGDAKAYIKNDPQFQAYIGHIKDGQKSVLGWSALGLFQPVRGSQLEIVNAPTNTQQPEQPKQSGQHGTQPEQSQPEQQSDGRSEQSQESDQPGQSDEHNEEPEQSQQSGQRSTQPEQQSEQSDRQSGHSEQSQESDRPGQSDEHNEQPEQSGQRDTQPEQYTAHLAQSDVGSEPPPSEGAFGNVLSNLSRRTVAASNVTTASHLEEEFVVAKDEQIVNDSIILLLKCAIMNVPGIKCQWTSHRSPFPDMKLGTNKLAALTDGYLEGTDGKVYAIVEAKAATRHRVDRPKVLWQEAAEIVAWILNDPVGSYPNQLVKPTGGVQPNCRLLISQDRHEIFLSVATYTSAYVKYLHGDKQYQDGKAQDASSFLKITEYGPWNIEKHGHMKHLAHVIVEFCLAISKEIV